MREYPHVPGIDFAGRGEASDDPRYKPGDKIVLTGWRVGETHWGSNSQKARVNADWLVPLGDCQRESLDALMLGRTLTGERVFDVMRSIDFIETRPELDKTRIGCMGNSTGGNVTFYAACVDPRIRLAVVFCSYCTYTESWMKIRHYACGYLPGILKVGDMGDLAGLVAPRNLSIVAGKQDYLATIRSVRTAFAQSNKIFAAADCPDNAELLVGDAGHRFIQTSPGSEFKMFCEVGEPRNDEVSPYCAVSRGARTYCGIRPTPGRQIVAKYSTQSASVFIVLTR